MDAAAQPVARDAAGRTGPDQTAQHSLQARWHVGLLGGLCLSDGPQRITRLPSRAITALLARLALAPQRAHAREELIELLWPGVARMIVSGRDSPQWAAGERDHQVRMGQQFQAYSRWSQELQRKTIEQRWQADATRQRGMRDILGGTVRLTDPGTGETFEASARERYYFRINGADRPTAIGSETDFKPVPNVDMTRLLKIGTEVADR